MKIIKKKNELLTSAFFWKLLNVSKSFMQVTAFSENLYMSKTVISKYPGAFPVAHPYLFIYF